MDLSHLAVQLVLAIVCASIANILIPRQIPGKFLGLILTGLVGVWVGEVGFQYLRTEFNLNYSVLYWNIQGVPIIPAIIGSAIVIYIVTTFLSWGRR